MRVLFVTQNDPIYVRIFFAELLRILPGSIDLVAIVIAPPMGKRSAAALARQMWDFYGPVDFVRMGFRYALLTVGSRLPRALRRGRACSIEQVAHDRGVAVRHVADLNAPEFVAWVRERGVDLLASVAAPQILREALLSAPRLGSVNIHNSKLPHYRGMLPNFWQMLHGEPVVGTTIHRINAELDEGAILAQIETPVEPGESLDALIRRTKHAGARFMIDTLEALAAGRLEERDNVAAAGSYFTFPRAADVRAFRRRGLKLL
jgi:methionyl-tRNA formyltransferase